MYVVLLLDDIADICQNVMFTSYKAMEKVDIELSIFVKVHITKYLTIIAGFAAGNELAILLGA